MCIKNRPQYSLVYDSLTPIVDDKFPYHIRLGQIYILRSVDVKDEKKKLKNVNMPWRWMSLETLERRVYTQASDIWSFGVVMWEIFSFGMMPYQTLDTDQILKFLQEVSCKICIFSVFKYQKCHKRKKRKLPTLGTLRKPVCL